MSLHETAAEEQSQCILFRLPTEIRLIVYEYVFPPSESKIYANEYIHRFAASKVNEDPPPPTFLLQTCRRINNEASEVFYNRTRLHVVIYNGFGDDARRNSFLKHTAKNKAALKRIKYLDITSWNNTSSEDAQMTRSRQDIADILAVLDHCRGVKDLLLRFWVSGDRRQIDHEAVGKVVDGFRVIQCSGTITVRNDPYMGMKYTGDKLERLIEDLGALVLP